MALQTPTSTARSFSLLIPDLLTDPQPRSDEGVRFVSGGIKPIPSEFLLPTPPDPTFHPIPDGPLVHPYGPDVVTIGAPPTGPWPEGTQTPSATIGGNPVLYPTGAGAAGPNPSAAVTLQAGPLELAVLGALVILAVKLL